MLDAKTQIEEAEGTLATGRQRGTFSENSCGKSYTKIWILKGGVQEEVPLQATVLPCKINIFVVDFPYEMFSKNNVIDMI